MSELDRGKKTTRKLGLGRGIGSLFGGEDGFLAGEANSASVERVGGAKSFLPTVDAVDTIGSPKSVRETERIWKVRIDHVKPNKDQPRKDFDKDRLRELSLSIKEKGILQPIVAKRADDKKFVIIAGERRWRAAQMAGLQEVPVILKESDEQEMLEWALIENIQRQDLNPMEEAEAYSDLIRKYQMTQQRLADKIGKERVTVANTLRLLTLSPDVKDLVARAELSMGQAKALLGLSDPKLQKEMAKKAIHLNLSVRELEGMVRKIRANSVVSEGMALEEVKETVATEETVEKRAVKTLSLELQRLLGTEVTIDYKKGKGRITIKYHSDEAMNEIVDKLREACQS